LPRVAIGKQLEQPIAFRSSRVAEVTHDKASIWRDLVQIKKRSHEADRTPMFVREIDILRPRRRYRPLLRPVSRIRQIALSINLAAHYEILLHCERQLERSRLYKSKYMNIVIA
jgi:hypothetical protein